MGNFNLTIWWILHWHEVVIATNKHHWQFALFPKVRMESVCHKELAQMLYHYCSQNADAFEYVWLGYHHFGLKEDLMWGRVHGQFVWIMDQTSILANDIHSYVNGVATTQLCKQCPDCHGGILCDDLPAISITSVFRIVMMRCICSLSINCYHLNTGHLLISWHTSQLIMTWLSWQMSIVLVSCSCCWVMPAKSSVHCIISTSSCYVLH